MSGAMPWSQSSPSALSNDPAEALQRIEKSLTSLGTWVKVLVVLTFILLAINLLYI
jgi:hypothetical protein